MALLLVIGILLTAAISGAVGGYLGVKYIKCVSTNNVDNIQMQVDYLKDTLTRKHEIAMDAIHRVDQREIDHWNFINLNCKLW